MDNNYCVYRHTVPNGKVYIGITCRKPQERWGVTGNRYKNNKHFYNAIQKYGWDNIKHEILYDGLTAEQAENYEKWFIFIHNSSDREFGYNNTLGGEHGKMSRHTNEENRQRGKLLIGDKNPFYGRKHSEETKTHLREVRLKNPNRFEQAKQASKKSKEKTQKRVAQYDLDGRFIAEYDSFCDAARSVTGGKAGGAHIGSVCAGKRKMAYGYIWKYAREEADSCG
jgi:group I intron endonuclease